MMNILSGMMGMGGGFGGHYSCTMRAYSAAFFDADAAKVNELNHGGKILLPNSTLDYLIRYNVPYPMLFKVSSTGESPRATNCGVLEFSAPEGKCYLPQWVIRVDSVTLPSATYAKLKPQSLEFLNISNPRAVLEVELRKFACLTKNDVIAVMVGCLLIFTFVNSTIFKALALINRGLYTCKSNDIFAPHLQYADQVLEFLVQEVKPSNAVCIIECDLNLDFDAPEGYVEKPNPLRQPSTFKPPAPAMKSLPVANGAHFSAFSGTGQRLDGRKKPSSNSLCSDQGEELLNTLTSLPPVVCIEDYKPGKLSFIRYDYKSRFETEREMQESKQSAGKKAVPFEGSSATIRRRY
ncbi:unnamed protein product [Strongylus vulgaris]|uniref:Uncharacterized protein n=1 Tax=Strongylus vulgaris TaxID=40348 RepID=A0A3P7JIT2_STRVU|nr:unnamed protein product [Strongylus vulgaris]